MSTEQLQPASHNGAGALNGVSHAGFETKPGTLSAEHQRDVLDPRAITPNVATERGYENISAQRARALGFRTESDGLLFHNAELTAGSSEINSGPMFPPSTDGARGRKSISSRKATSPAWTLYRARDSIWTTRAYRSS